MSIRTSLSLALAIALVAVGTSYGQQSGAGAAQQQVDTSSDAQQQSGTLDRLNATDQSPARQTASDERIEHRAGFRGTPAHDEMGRTARLSEIMDLDVHNAQDEDLGDIEDIVVDVDSGTIRYVAVSVGGFLGVGDRLVAVPWKSFRHQKDEDGDALLVLNIDKQRLENAPGFNQENWPDFGSERYSSEIDKYYGTGTDATRDSTTTRSTTTIRTTAPPTQPTQNRAEPQSQQQ